MYSWEKSLREQKSSKHPMNPSFSSTLLDEIYRSIDEKGEDLKLCRESHNSTGVRVKTSSIEDDQMASLKRACLLEKWMEKKVHDKVSSRGMPPSLPKLDNKSILDNDPLFFSSTSSSSDSSSGGLSSSDTEFFASAKSRKSCFAPPWPKPVRTSVSPRLGHKKELHVSEEYQNQQASKAEENLIKSKSRALKIYANLKKVKQPISPGGRLTCFINSIFNNGNAKKGKTSSTNGGYENARSERKSKSTQASTCSSASSFSRSCLSKCPPNSRGKMTDGEKRTVRFYPFSIIVDEDSRPCGHKSIYDEDSNELGRPTLPQNASQPRQQLGQNNRKAQGSARETFKAYQDQKINFLVDKTLYHDGEEDGNYDDDAASDSSSDLFEIDHLALFGNNRFCEELPVYETTHLDTNLAIASGLIR